MPERFCRALAGENGGKECEENQSRRLETINKSVEKGTMEMQREGGASLCAVRKDEETGGGMGVWVVGKHREEARLCSGHWRPREDALMKGAWLFPGNWERHPAGVLAVEVD